MRMLLLLFVMLALAPAAGADTVLLMLEQKRCEWCQRWDREVGLIYGQTAEGRAAPLLRQDIHAPLPEGVTLTRRAHYTPTFVLLRDGAELGRIEGYPGEDFFYGLLQKLLESAGQEPREGA